MEFSILRNLFVVLVMTAILTVGIPFILQKDVSINPAAAIIGNQNSVLASAANSQNSEHGNPLPPPPPQKLSNPPEIIKSIYVTGYSAGSKSYSNYLKNLFNNTEINAVVIDIKGSDGYVTYDSGAEDVKKYNLTNYAISDIDSLIRFFHNQNIYVIGRIAVFEDPQYSKARPELAIYNKAESGGLWKDNNGLAWLDPASKDVWNYNISLAKDALYHGFDEINFDYIRFPTDGRIKNMGFPVYDWKKIKSEIINEFFMYLRENLSGEKISADLFGLTTVNPDDMGIGQILEDALKNFDYVSPMVYPSHYANGFIGYANPADHPYEVINYSMEKAAVRKSKLIINQLNLAKLRPWIQDFNMGAFYTADMVKQEIKAIEDALGDEYNGFMLWNPNNIYTQAAVPKLNQ